MMRVTRDVAGLRAQVQGLCVSDTQLRVFRQQFLKPGYGQVRSEKEWQTFSLQCGFSRRPANNVGCSSVAPQTVSKYLQLIDGTRWRKVPGRYVIVTWYGLTTARSFLERCFAWQSDVRESCDFVTLRRQGQAMWLCAHWRDGNLGWTRFKDRSMAWRPRPGDHDCILLLFSPWSREWQRAADSAPNRHPTHYL